MLRIALFLGTNLAILVVIGVVWRLLGIDGLLMEKDQSLNMTALLVMAALFGFGGSFISLAISKWMAKRSMGVQIIEQPENETEQWLVNTVARQAEQAGIGMPEVGYFNSAQPNAFATGMSRNNALVAVSTGLLNHMSRDEVEAVLGHEVSHVANGDMITLTLIQGVVNTFVIFLSRVVGFFVDRVLLKNERGLGIGYFVASIVAEILLGFLATMIVMWFSRRREFRADEGGARLSSREKMASALRALQRQHEPEDLPGEFAAFGINGGLGSGMKKLFMSHPPLEERIAALENSREM